MGMIVSLRYNSAVSSPNPYGANRQLQLGKGGAEDLAPLGRRTAHRKPARPLRHIRAADPTDECDTLTPLAGGLACLDLEDEVSYGREGKVRAVAEDGVASTGKTYQAGGLRRQPAG